MCFRFYILKVVFGTSEDHERKIAKEQLKECLR